MEPKTQPRGPSDTRRLSPLVVPLVLSLLIHAGAVPLHFARLPLLRMLGLSSETASYEDHPTVIPIDLEFGEEPQAPPSVPTQAPTATLEPPDNEGIADAGAQKAKDAALDAPPDTMQKDSAADTSDGSSEADTASDAEQDVEDAGPAEDAADAAPETGVSMLDAQIAVVGDAAASPEASATGASGSSSAIATGPKAPDAGMASNVRDPVGLGGTAGAIAPQNPNVSVLVYTDRIRRHPIATEFGPLLGMIPEWNAFFAGTGLDPLKDTDRMLLAGPQFRDTSRVVAVVQYNVPEAKVKAAVRSIMARDPGHASWVDGGVAAARARAHNADRVFVMPAPKILVVVPPDGESQALRLPRTTRFPRGKDEAAIIFLKTPRLPMRAAALDVPASVEWMRASIQIATDNGVDVTIDAKDKDAQTARETAASLTRQVDALTLIPIINRRLLDPFTLRGEGDHVKATFHVTPQQLRTLMSLVAVRIESITGKKMPMPK